MIDRCVCFNKTFDKILFDAKVENIASLDELKNAFKMFNKCCMCNPYIEESLKTGQVKFNKII